MEQGERGISMSMDNKIVLVVAGNETEFKNYVLDLAVAAGGKSQHMPGRSLISGTEFIFMSSPQKMRGFRGVEVKRIGTWRSRSDADELERLIPAVETR